MRQKKGNDKTNPLTGEKEIDTRQGSKTTEAREENLPKGTGGTEKSPLILTEDSVAVLIPKKIVKNGPKRDAVATAPQALQMKSHNGCPAITETGGAGVEKELEGAGPTPLKIVSLAMLILLAESTHNLHIKLT